MVPRNAGFGLQGAKGVAVGKGGSAGGRGGACGRRATGMSEPWARSHVSRSVAMVARFVGACTRCHEKQTRGIDPSPTPSPCLHPQELSRLRQANLHLGGARAVFNKSLAHDTRLGAAFKMLEADVQRTLTKVGKTTSYEAWCSASVLVQGGAGESRLGAVVGSGSEATCMGPLSVHRKAGPQLHFGRLGGRMGRAPGTSKLHS